MRPWVSSPVPHIPGQVAHTSNSSSVEVGSGDQNSMPFLATYLKAALDTQAHVSSKHTKSLCLATQLHCFKYKISDDPQRKIKEAFIIQQEAPWERVG